jgi:hypothetical protein
VVEEDAEEASSSQSTRSSKNLIPPAFRHLLPFISAKDANARKKGRYLARKRRNTMEMDLFDDDDDYVSDSQDESASQVS